MNSSEMNPGRGKFNGFYDFCYIEILMYLSIFLDATKAATLKGGLLFIWFYFFSGGISQLSSSVPELMQMQCLVYGCALPQARTMVSGMQKGAAEDEQTNWPKKKKRKKNQRKSPTSESFFSATFTQKYPARSRRKRTTTVISPSVSLVATVFNKANKEQLSGIGLEVYQQQNDRVESLLTKRTFGHGVIISTLNRDFNHRLVITKPGFHRTEVILTKEEMKELRLLKKEFELDPDVTVHSIALPILYEEVQNEQSDNPFSNVAPTIAIIVPVDTVTERTSANKDKPRVIIVYEVLQSSVIRQEPNEASALLLSVSKGSRLELLEKTNALWYKVRFRDFVGFLPVRMLRLEK